MNRMKKFASLLLALVMALALAAPALAAGETGTITITNAHKGAVYNAYQIFVLESYNEEENRFAYTVNPAWEGFMATSKAQEYVQVVDGYVKWVNADDTDNSDNRHQGAAVVQFAKLAMAYLKDHPGIEAAGTTGEVAEDGEATISGLPLGYYLLDSTVGTVCSLDTVTPSVDIMDKNDLPTTEKKIVEGADRVTENTAGIGDKIEYETTIEVKVGAQNYILHDKMDEGLTFNNDVTIDGLTEDEDYTVTAGNEGENPCTFHVVFEKSYLESITANTEIVVKYSATLNEKAKVKESGSNDNKTWMSYGGDNEFKTTETSTKTYTYEFDLVKTNKDNVIISDAEFELYTEEEGGDKIDLVLENGIYRVATATEAAVEGFTSAVIKAGSVTIRGLKDGTYYLEETKAPDGYNKLQERFAVTIAENGSNKAHFAEDDANKWESGGAHVVNNTGTELPATGGIGTTIFYVVGSVLVLGAVILLVTKKRMSTK